MNDTLTDSILFQFKQANERIDKMFDNIQSLEAEATVHRAFIRALASTLDSATLNRIRDQVVSQVNESIRAQPEGRWSHHLREAHSRIDLSSIRGRASA